MSQRLLAERIYAIAEEVMAPSSMGFVLIRRGFWGRQVDPDIVHLLKLSAWKGATYSVQWGASFAYVPHEWKSALRFHRTFKAARFDLFEFAQDECLREGGRWEDMLASVLDGEDVFRRELTNVWKWARPRAEMWWAAVQSATDVLDMARHQMIRPPVGHDRLRGPMPWLVETFALARLGRDTEAKTLLTARLAAEREESSPWFSPDGERRLLDGIAKVANEARRPSV